MLRFFVGLRLALEPDLRFFYHFHLNENGLLLVSGLTVTSIERQT
jgi:hypothetical protein